MPNVSNIYDLIVPLGYACSCSQALRRAELQLASFPWDWVGVPPPSEKCRIICDGFRDFMNLEDLKWIGVNDTYGHEEVLNTRNGLIILHDFVSTAPLGEQYPLVASKYARRIERLDRCLRAAKRVLLVCIDAPVTPVPTPPEDCRRAIDEMSAKYPNAKFDFLLMNLEHGRARAEMIDETPVEGVRRVACAGSRSTTSATFRARRPTAWKSTCSQISCDRNTASTTTARKRNSPRTGREGAGSTSRS